MTDQNKPDEAIRCPFCGAIPEIRNTSSGPCVVHGVITDDCIVAGRVFRMEAWRRRADLAIQKPSADRERDLEALDQIEDWLKAYPEDIFPKPDYIDINKILKQNGYSIDRVSADCMRHTISRVIEILKPVRTALSQRGQSVETREVDVETMKQEA